MKVLVVGSGGREHALAWRLSQSTRVHDVYVAPGNAGADNSRKVSCVPIAADDTDALVAFARDNDIRLTVIGPEPPLVAGIVDRFTAEGLRCFGPSQAAAQLEGSKAFTKDFLARHGIPTAPYAIFDDLAAASDHIRQHGAPLVVKADGLAAGKGVTVAHSVEAALDAARDALQAGVFGGAGRRIVVEQFLQGEEASFIAMVDGQHVLPLATSQDHKARDDGDRGPNTGGMGAYSPAPVVDGHVHRRIMDRIIEPTVRGLQADGIHYRGFLYAGLMLDGDGNPHVLEYNCRLGDPEAQVILMRLQSDLAELCEAAIDGRLNEVFAQWDPRVALGVVMSSAGYPGPYETGKVISGLQADPPGVKVFHSGTANGRHGIATAGGRVLCVCALGESVLQAQRNAYERVETIGWEGAYYRRDIGHRAITRGKQPD